MVMGRGKRTRTGSSENLKDLYQPHIIECKNIVGDDHCGFRYVAGLMEFGEKNWARICQNLMNELSHHVHLYTGAFIENGRVQVVLDALNCFTKYEPYKN